VRRRLRFAHDFALVREVLPTEVQELIQSAYLLRSSFLNPRSQMVAVGTAIADRPPHRSVRARLRIRLLPRMNGVKAFVGIRMQNTRLRNPPA
jgi:hypothetical protein